MKLYPVYSCPLPRPLCSTRSQTRVHVVIENETLAAVGILERNEHDDGLGHDLCVRRNVIAGVIAENFLVRGHGGIVAAN